MAYVELQPIRVNAPRIERTDEYYKTYRWATRLFVHHTVRRLTHEIEALLNDPEYVPNEFTSGIRGIAQFARERNSLTIRQRNFLIKHLAHSIAEDWERE